ncbi:hypothetical protein AAG906_034191 [Vitis piasezkii]
MRIKSINFITNQSYHCVHGVKDYSGNTRNSFSFSSLNLHLSHVRFCSLAIYSCCVGVIIRFLATGLNLLLEVKVNFMDDGLGKIEVFPDHFHASTPIAESVDKENRSFSHSRTDNSFSSHSRSWARRKLRSAASMLNLFSLRGLPWGSSSDDQEKVELTVAELESLRTELASLEEREAHFKAQLEHVDEILRSARLSGYLYIRTRWAALPGEPPPIDDTEVDDWLPRFVVLHGSCLFFYMLSTECHADLSPQDSTLLSDVTEVGPLPNLTREDEEIRYCFYILTCHGLRYECSSVSKVQVDSWLTALRLDCKTQPEPEPKPEPEPDNIAPQ